MSSEIIEQPIPPIPYTKPPFYQDPQVWVLIGGAFLLLVVKLIQFCGPKKQVLGRARWATGREINLANKKAHQQIHTSSIKENALWIIEPKGIQIFGKKVVVPFDSSIHYIPDINGSIAIMGASNAGKSYSVFQRLQFSAIFQGHTIVDFDAKASEKTPPSCTTGGLALKYGYDVFLLDPFGDDTDTINLWDVLEPKPEYNLGPENDTDTALTLFNSFMANLGMDAASSSGNSGFFNKSGVMLLSAIFLVIRTLPREYHDFAMMLKIIAMPNLIRRVQHNIDKIPEYVKGVWAQFLSLEKSEETAQGVAGTATIILGSMFTPELLSIFRGNGTSPTRLNGRQMMIFRLNPDRVSHKALVGATMEIVHRRSLYQKNGRRNPLGLFKDEAPQLRYTGFSSILNLQRSQGGYCVIAAQGRQAMLETHTDKEVDAILGGCGTLIIGSLRGNADCKYFSESLSSKQVQISGKSRTSGKSSSTTSSENTNTTPLMETHEIEGLRQGEFVFKIPAVGKKQGSRPFKQSVRIPEREKKRIEEGLNAWHELRPKKRPKPLTEEELRRRELIAYKLFPLPEDQPDPEVVSLIQEVF